MVIDAGVTPASTVQEGLEATWRLVADPSVDGVSGAYFNGTREVRADAQAYDLDARRRLRERPSHAPGVRRLIRRGKPIPAGYVLVGQKVDVQRGAKTAGAALKFTCPEGKRLKTFGVTGHAGFLAPRTTTTTSTTNVMSFPPPHLQQASGTVYAVCR